YAGFRTFFEELLNALVPEALDHCVKRIARLYGCQLFQSSLTQEKAMNSALQYIEHLQRHVWSYRQPPARRPPTR
ncbi:MAG TPA: hypothetical protein VJ023_02420, partial [Pyrinomonadaceae bacterium]|nr:hypothetical protein [Pyrinomonadaceae bacterium]